MTTIIKISAHISEDKEIIITTEEMGAVLSTDTVQSGETKERYVYDSLSINIKEVDK